MPSISTLLFTLAACLLVYLVVGYPLLLAVYPWHHRPQIAKDPARLRLVTVLLPVYNGAGFIRQKLESILALDYPRDLLEILVISDGSTDATDTIANEFIPSGVRLLRVPRGGKAAALNAGIEQARGEILFFTDVRQRLAPDSLRHLVACLADPTVGSVTGELHIVTGDRQEEADMGLYWRYEVWARKQMTQIDSIFGATGCIYAMRRELVEPIPPDTLGDDTAFPLGAFFRGYRMILDAEAKAYDLASPLGSEFDRRMRTLAGLWQTLVRRPELLGLRDRMWLHFVSHKVGRLLLPWLALAALGSAFWLDSPWREGALGLAGVFLALAALDSLLPQRSLLKRISSPARTTLVMLAASMCSISVFLVSPQRLWKRTRVGAEKAED
ncbi:MAG: glycosyltransferase family 2 protein [Acidobacteriia bacterium]|nr:glycosyltransferase family 2 protein [Terriglobia bacterium]